MIRTTNNWAFLLAIMFLALLRAPALSYTWEAQFSVDLGSSDTIDEDDEVELDYSFSKNTFKLGRKITPLWEYDLTVSEGRKDYDEEDHNDLDNSRLNIINSVRYENDNSRERDRWAFDVDYENKQFEDDPGSSFNEIDYAVRRSYKLKGSHMWSASGGLSNLMYSDTSREGENIANIKLGFERYFFDDDLTLDGYTNVISSSRSNYGVHMTNKLGTTVVIHQPHISRLRVWCKTGFRNSRFMEEGLDDDDTYYDYGFNELSISTKHPIVDGISGDLSYLIFTKEYIGAPYDNSGFQISNSYKYRANSNLFYRVGYSYKGKAYSDTKSLSYNRNQYYVETNYRKKLDWGASLKATKSFYEYPDDQFTKDEVSTRLTLQLSKYFTREIELILAGDYKFKDYEETPDLALTKWHFGSQYKW